MKFVNLEKNFESGMQDFLAFHHMTALPFEIEITEVNNDRLEVRKCENRVKFFLSKPYQIFRALTILKMHLDEETFNYSETCYFKTGGPMFDGSQASSLMNVASAKKMMLILAGMGFNMMMLYCEDCYEIDGEPYFGMMRPRYSQEELKLLDDYAYSLGIELIPCIQTLGHLTDMLNKRPYRVLADQPSVLLVGEDEVYKLIDKMLYTMSNCFRSRRIHLGLDEAFGLGLGNYLRKNGYKSQTEIMKEHLERVYALAQKYGFHPMMWCDMFFRAKSKLDTYLDPDIVLDERDRHAVPDGMDLIYWDYYSCTTEHYESFINKVKYLSDNVIFAGAARNGRTFGCHYQKGKLTIDAALTACKNCNVQEFIATVWGDDHRESSNFSILTQLQYFAEHMYSQTPDDVYVTKRFAVCTNVEWQTMMDIDALDAVPGYTEENIDNSPVSRGLMWQNILLGILDADIAAGKFHDHYALLKDKFKESAKNYPEFAYLFSFYFHVANVLKDKAEAGIHLAAAYAERDMDTLKEYALKKLPQLMENAKALRLAHRDYFYTEYKPIGWEILDVRYGSLIFGIDTAIQRLTDFLDGKISKIEELEEKRLRFSGCKTIPGHITFTMICSASRI